MPLHAPGCTVPRHVPLGEPQSDAWVGELERRPGVVTCRGKWLAAVAVLPRLGTCRSPGLAGTRGASRRAFLRCLGWPSRQAPLAGVLCFERPSRQAPLAGALLSSGGRPGKLLLPGPWLKILCSWMAQEGAMEGFWWSPGKPCRGVLRLPVHKFGVLRHPYF